MAANVFYYNAGDELPGLTLPWQYESAANTWTDLDLSSGYTYTLTLVGVGSTVDVSPSATVTGAVGSVSIAWATGDLATAGVYTIDLVAREVATSKDRSYNPKTPVKIVVK